MPNQLNYKTELGVSVPTRPSRISDADVKKIVSNQTQVVFGTSNKDVVELWLYNPDDTFAGHVNILPSDPSLTLKTVLDESGSYQMLNMDLVDILNQINLPAGRYSIVSNFFRNEVGAEDGYKLFISEVSTDRTLVKIQLVNPDELSLKELYEFVVPSVPRVFAQAIIDQMFNKAINVPENKKISLVLALSRMNTTYQDTMARLTNSNSLNEFSNLMEQILEGTYLKAVDKLIADVGNYYIQRDEILAYITTALDETIEELTKSGIVDPRFTIV